MSFLTLRLPNGMLKNGTRYQAKGRWFDGNLVRFFDGTVRPVGGWALQSTSTEVIDLVGVPRGAIAWEVTGGRAWQAFGTVGQGSAFALKFQDQFTGAGPVTLDTTTPDLPVGEGWQTTGGNLMRVLNNELVNGWGGVGDVFCHSDGVVGVTLAVGDECFADVQRWDDVFVFGSRAGFGFLGDGANDLLFVFMRSIDGTDQVVFGAERKATAGTFNALAGTYVAMPRITLADKAWIRLGITIISTTTFEFWTEPVGGGARTVYVLDDNLITTENGYWKISADYFDASHDRAVAHMQARGATSINGVKRDNLTYQTPGGPAKLYSFSQGLLYDITPTGLDPGEEDTQIGGGASSGFYGAGEYGLGVYGVGQSTIGAVDDADIWHLDTFGNFIVATMVPTNNEIYYYDPSTPATAAILMPNAPTNLRGVVITPERFVVALGADGNSRQVAWSDRDNFTVWTPTPGNEAGDYILEGGGRIMRGLRGRQETLIWTDTELWSMTFIGGLFIYSFSRRGTHCGLQAPLAVVEINGAHVWMGQRGFYTYDGYVRPLPCEVRDYVFNNMNKDQRMKINGFNNHEFNEVWWFYPSSESTEIDRYVAWNYLENHWTTGKLSRTCGFAATTTSTKPVLLDANGFVYQHEIGTDHTSNQPVEDSVPYVDSGPIELAQGDQLMHVLEVIPDEANSGDTQFFLIGSGYPNDAGQVFGPFSSLDPTPVRMLGRQVQLRIEENVAEDWRVGNFRLDVQPGGRR